LKVSSQGLRRERKDFGTDFRIIVPLIPYKVGWRVLWCSITIGGVNLTVPFFSSFNFFFQF